MDEQRWGVTTNSPEPLRFSEYEEHPQHPKYRQTIQAGTSDPAWRGGLMDTQIRRLLPRQVVDWCGAYSIEGSTDENWGDCRVIDVSSGGAGLQVLETPNGVEIGKNIVLSIRLKGEIKDVRPLVGNQLRVGIQFTDVTQREQAYLASIIELQARW